LKAFIPAVLFFALAACSQNGADQVEPQTDSTATNTTSAAPMTSATKPAAPRPDSAYVNKIAELHTTAGQINLRFFPKDAPNHVRNFIDLSESGFYNGTKFHRVIPGFMIQGGDPNTKAGDPSTWGTGGSGHNVNAEFNNREHKRGILSMARTGDPNGASSQFFICVDEASQLNNQYTVFGEVTQGMDVVDKIVNAPTRGETPIEPVAITKVVIRDATAAEKPAQ